MISSFSRFGLFRLLVLFLLIFATLLNGQSRETFPTIDPKAITIARDSFGVPHIIAKTDAEVAYGLAWVNAEDAFEFSQDLIYAAKGFMGRKGGLEGVKTDFYVHAIGARKLVEERYESDLSPEFKKYINGFAQGINAFAAAHPEEVKVKKAFPVDNKDVVTAYVVMMSFLSWTSGPVGDAVGGKFDKRDVVFDTTKTPPYGSNAFALRSNRTEDGKTYLCINPHLKMEGQLSFYEASLHSEEGLNMEGAMFHGSASLAMGSTPNLGWGMTWNYFDKVDEFKLKMHPKLRLLYEFDGQYLTLEKRPVWLKVRLGKHVVLPVRKMTYWSKYGCTLKSSKSNNFYAIRFPANMTIKTAEQLYRMNKAQTFEQFREALRLHALTFFNIVYADKENNVMYLSNGMMPDRNQGYDWSKMLAGNTSKTLWTKLVPIDSMPHVINPKCGYVFNTNNSPFNATAQGENDNPARLPKYVDERPGDNNRAHRLMEFFASKDKFSFDDLKAIKFDHHFSKNTILMKNLAPLFNLNEAKYPDLKEEIKVLKAWDYNTDTNSVATTYLGLVVDPLFSKKRYGDEHFVFGIKTDEQEIVSYLRAGCDSLRKYFGSTNVKWGMVHRNERGGKSYAADGFADVLSPSYPKRVGSGLKYVTEHGDTYTMLVKFGKDGAELTESLLPRGNSINPKSKHFNDQMELFRDQKMRVATFNNAELLKKAERIYNPL